MGLTLTGPDISSDSDSYVCEPRKVGEIRILNIATSWLSVGCWLGSDTELLLRSVHSCLASIAQVVGPVVLQKAQAVCLPWQQAQGWGKLQPR